MGDWPVGYLHNAVEELHSGLPWTNPDSSRVEDLNQGLPDFKSSALNHSTTLSPLKYRILIEIHINSLWYFGSLFCECVNTMFILGSWSSFMVANISEHFNNFNNKGQTTTPGTSCPTLCHKRVGSLTSPADHNIEDAGDGAYGLWSLSEKTWTSNHLQI